MLLVHHKRDFANDPDVSTRRGGGALHERAFSSSDEPHRRCLRARHCGGPRVRNQSASAVGKTSWSGPSSPRAASKLPAHVFLVPHTLSPDIWWGGRTWENLSRPLRRLPNPVHEPLGRVVSPPSLQPVLERTRDDGLPHARCDVRRRRLLLRREASRRGRGQLGLDVRPLRVRLLRLVGLVGLRGQTRE